MRERAAPIDNYNPMTRDYYSSYYTNNYNDENINNHNDESNFEYTPFFALPQRPRNIRRAVNFNDARLDTTTLEGPAMRMGEVRMGEVGMGEGMAPPPMLPALPFASRDSA
jgi:hypothetical protein